MVVEASGESYVQNLVAKSATSPPWGAVGHNSKRPLRRPRPGDKYQWSEKQLSGMSFWSHSCIIVVWGWNLLLGVEVEDNYITRSICVYARPLLNQVRDSLVAAQDDHVLAQES